MPVRYVTHPNGAIEIIGNRTPKEEAEWFSRHNRVSRFPSANHRSAVKAADKESPKLEQEEQLPKLLKRGLNLTPALPREIKATGKLNQWMDYWL